MKLGIALLRPLVHTIRGRLKPCDFLLPFSYLLRCSSSLARFFFKVKAVIAAVKLRASVFISTIRVTALSRKYLSWDTMTAVP
jgi:hypothetical protein